MDKEYPPLPSVSREPPEKKVSSSRVSTPATVQSGTSEESSSAANGFRAPSSTSKTNRKVISSQGDVIIEYKDGGINVSNESEMNYQWQVSSEDLTRHSPYFAALLDPNKFYEGRAFLEKKTEISELRKGDENSASVHADELPVVNLNVERLSRRFRASVVDVFLRILCAHSMDEHARADFDAEIKHLSTSVVANLIEISDLLNSPYIVRDTLKRSGYAFGKVKVPLSKFTSALLKFSEERVRQTIFIAIYLEDHAIFQVLTHTLVLIGSKSWVNGVGIRDPESPRWWYLPHGLEDDLYYRRQCVLNTITDLQAHFLRVYGALEDPRDPKASPSNTTPGPASISTSRSRPFQCRWGFSNSRACDAFHLGEMTRFFAIRTKTIFLGSTLIDPDFDLDPENESSSEGEGGDTRSLAANPPSEISSIIASLRQIPDYQIDSNHTGCGIRRRLLPALDVIERFVADGRGLLGPVLRYWKSPPATNSISWMDRSLRRAETVDVRYSKIVSINRNPAGPLYPGPLPPGSQEEDARLFFTAKKRNWET
ncbi:high-affinity iron permease [Paecilomyces lecythidis]